MTLNKKSIATLILSCSLSPCTQSMIATTRPVALPAQQSNPSVDSARRLFDAGNYTAAITALKSAIAQNANNADAHYWLGRSYYEAKDLDNAVAEGERSIALDAKNSDYHRWLGEYYGEQADRQHSFFLARKVKKEFEDAVKLNPSNIKARRDLEEFEIQAPGIVGGNKDDAKAQVDAIAAISPAPSTIRRS